MADRPKNPREYDPEDMPTVPPWGEFDTADVEQARPVTPVADASPDNPVEIAPGVTVLDPRLGRVPFFDPRSRNFPMRAAVDEKKYRPRSYTWSVGRHLDQGSEPSCVGYAWTHELLARPAVVDQPDGFASWVYRTAQRYDAWAGESYAGTSVLAGAKVVQKRPPEMPEGRGLIGEYRWVFGDLDDLVKTLGYFGPVVFGTWWKAGMMQADSDGFIRATGENYGGHAYLVTAVDLDDRRLRVHNSWGTGWGMDGDAWLSFGDAEALLNDQGECCVPMRRLTMED